MTEIVINPTLTAVTRGVNGLSTIERTQIAQALTQARALALNAQTQTARAIQELGLPNKDVFDLGPNFVAALRTCFALPPLTQPEANIVALPTLTYVNRYYARIIAGLQGHVELVSMDPGTQIANAFRGLVGAGQTRGYVRGGNLVRSQGLAEAPGRMHIDFSNLANTADTARVIVHEASHKYCGTVDHAYFGSFNTLDFVKAKNNADSYAYFAATAGLAWNV
jgi:hypothetical protein